MLKTISCFPDELNEAQKCFEANLSRDQRYASLHCPAYVPFHLSWQQSVNQNDITVATIGVSVTKRSLFSVF